MDQNLQQLVSKLPQALPLRIKDGDVPKLGLVTLIETQLVGLSVDDLAAQIKNFAGMGSFTLYHRGTIEKDKGLFTMSCALRRNHSDLVAARTSL